MNQSPVPNTQYPNPLTALLHSRKFLLLVLDTLVALALYFANKYAPAGIFHDIEFVILALQPVVIAVIIAIAWEDAALKRSRNSHL